MSNAKYNFQRRNLWQINIHEYVQLFERQAFMKLKRNWILERLLSSKINTYKFDINYQPTEFVNLEVQAQEMQG